MPDSCQHLLTSYFVGQETQLMERTRIRVGMMHPIQHRCGDNFAFRLFGKLSTWLVELSWNMLLNPLMGASLVVVSDIGIHDLPQLVGMQYQARI